LTRRLTRLMGALDHVRAAGAPVCKR
jgi:hypothetical protein